MKVRKTASLAARVAFREAVDWFPQANCRGMGAAFTEATHEEQAAVCQGRGAPWMKRCPVIEQCLADVFVREELYGVSDITAGDLVQGGLTPRTQRRLIRDVARERERESAVTIQ